MGSKKERRQRGGLFEGGINAEFCKVVIVGMFLFSIAPPVVSTSNPLYADTPWLHVDGNKIKDPNGNVVVLRGVDMIDLGAAEMYEGGAIEMIDRLTNKNDANGSSPGWYPTVIRLAVFPSDESSTFSPWYFDTNHDHYYNDLLRPVVNYCKSKDLYVIIDWLYVANTYDHVATTSEFWTYMAPKFANDSHVIFVLFNEPINDLNGDWIFNSNDTADWLSVRTDMQTWINIVRTYAPNNLILVSGAFYSEIIGPAATYPLTGDNIAIDAHIYPGHWLDSSWSSSYKAQINTCLTRYPVFMSEWGFCESSSDPKLRGTITNYGQPLMDFAEERKISHSAWVASPYWEPPMFNYDPDTHVWTLRVGEGEMGGFVKDCLYEKRNAERIIDLTAKKCTVKAGKVQGQDTFTSSGAFSNCSPDLDDIGQIIVTITSLTDSNVIYTETLDINDVTSKVSASKGTLSYKHKIPKGGDGAITALALNFNKRTFSLSSKSIDLTGLGCPLRLEFNMGYYTLTGDVNETIVNGKKSIPTRLMRKYDDTLIVTKASVKNSTAASSDKLSVKGDIAVADMNVDANEPNLVTKDVVITWSNVDDTNTQTFTIPHGSFKASKKGHLYKCSKINPVITPVEDVNTLVTASIDLDKCTFTVSIIKSDLDVASGDVKFGLSFATFNETDDLSF